MGAIAVGAIGAGLSAGGGYLSGQSQNRAARQARDLQSVMFGRQHAGLNQFLYGNQNLEQVLGMMEPGIRERYIRDNLGIDDKELKAQGKDLSTMSPRDLVAYLETKGVTGGGGGPMGDRGFFGQRQDLAKWLSNRQAEHMGRFDRDTADLQRMGDAQGERIQGHFRGSEGTARDFGRGAEALIREEADRSLRGANQQSKASLSAMGFGNSTAVANQAGQNAANIGRGARQQMLGVRQATTDRLLGVRGQSGQALADWLGGSRQLAYGRANTRTGLADQYLTRNLGQRQDTLNTLLGAQTGAIMNPWLTTPTSQFFPGASGAGNAMQSFGNTATAFAGQMFGQRPSGGPYTQQGPWQNGYGRP